MQDIVNRMPRTCPECKKDIEVRILVPGDARVARPDKITASLFPLPLSRQQKTDAVTNINKQVEDLKKKLDERKWNLGSAIELLRRVLQKDMPAIYKDVEDAYVAEQLAGLETQQKKMIAEITGEMESVDK